MVRVRSVLLGVLLVALLLVSPAGQGNVITVTTGTSYQTINGWEAVDQSGQGSANWNNVKDQLQTAVIDDAGITRIRLELTPGAENTTPCSSGPCEDIVNDNGDAFVINSSGFTWPRVDDQIAKVIVPMRALMAARGKTLWVSVCYVSFTQTKSDLHINNAEEYAEFMEAFFIHMDTTYGFVPNSIEMILEPDNPVGGCPGAGCWNGTKIGNALKATSTRLATHGWTPDFVAPSVANADSTFMLSDMLAVSGVTAIIDEISFHRYGGVTGGALTYVSTAQANSKRIGMLEYGPATITELLYDLNNLFVNAWQMEGIAFNFGSQSSINNQEAGFGANYFYILDTGGGSIQMSKRTAELRQANRYVLPGAVMLEVSSNFGSIPENSVAAFRNPDGNIVVIQNTPFGGNVSWTVAGLPAGTYGLSYTLIQSGTCANSCTQMVLSDQVIGAGGTVSANLPSQGTLTVWGKNASNNPRRLRMRS
jgi:hypothetical protein